MDNEVLIHVRVKNDGKIGFENFAKDADTHAKTISTSFTEKLTEGIRARFADKAPRILSGAGAGSPENFGREWIDRFGQGIRAEENKIWQDANGRWRNSFGQFARAGAAPGGDTKVDVNRQSLLSRLFGRDNDKVKVDVDVNKQSLFSRLFGAGKDGAKSFQDGFQSAFSGAFSGDFITLFLKWLGIAGLATAAAPVIGAALSAAVLTALGGGVIGAGIVMAFKDPRIKQQLGFLKKDVQDTFGDFGGHFVFPLIHFFDGLHGVIRQVKPMIDQIGETFGPVADQLGKGIIGFLQNALPGILRATEASAPLVKTLADKLPGIGDAIGRFFDHIKNGAPDANQFFSDLLTGLKFGIRFLGIIIEWTTRAYSVFRYAFFTMLNIAATWAVGVTGAARAAFGWVPGLGPKLDAAAHKAAQFKNNVNKQLNGINDVDIEVRIHTVGLAAAQAIKDLARVGRAGKKATGGIVGAAASGGIRSNLTMVGESGPELVELPPGARVNSNPDTTRMLSGAAGAGGGQPIIVQLVLDGRVLAQQLIEPTRDLVRTLGRGNVQTLLGVPGAA